MDMLGLKETVDSLSKAYGVRSYLTKNDDALLKAIAFEVEDD